MKGIKGIITSLIISTIFVWFIFWHGCRMDQGAGAATRKSKTLYFNVSHYCQCARCCSRRFADGKFASGKKVYYGGIAAPKKYKFGTKIQLEHPVLGTKIYIVEDRGPKIKSNKIDIFISRNMGGHKRALKLGRLKIKGRLIK